MNENVVIPARNDVLDFYSKLQFNEMTEPEAAAEMIRKSNAVETIYPDISDLIYADDVLEMGCGIGWFVNSIQYYYRGGRHNGD